jgi:hypothetical protein
MSKRKKIMIVVGRYPYGVAINPMEYLLNEDKTVRKFENEEKARDFLKAAGLNKAACDCLEYLPESVLEESVKAPQVHNED